MNNFIYMKVAPQAFPDSVSREHFRDEVHPVNGCEVTAYRTLLPCCPQMEDRREMVIPGVWVKVSGLDAYELVKGGWLIEYLDDNGHPSGTKKYHAHITPTEIVL